ncbi:MAG: hypothetical protein RLZZ210_415 [Pseudomonadota bacterium]|jgi:hypothetical protein
MDNSKYQYTPKILQKILVKILKNFNIYQDLCPIDWSSPIRFAVDDAQDANNSNDIHRDFINIVYTDGYLVFLWDLFYKNTVSKSWHFLNELNNPLYQPSILLYTNHAESRLVLWSKENYQGLTYDITNEWLLKFINIMKHIKQHVTNNQELNPLASSDIYASYSNNMKG